MTLTTEQCIEIAERRSYNSTHEWLRTRFGKAYRCEMESCAGKSKRFEWSLKKGFVCERKRENFWTLCSGCHINYDRSPDTFAKISRSLTGRKLTPEHAKKIGEANTGGKRTLESRKKMSDSKKGKKLSEDHNRKISEAMKKRSALEALK